MILIDVKLHTSATQREAFIQLLEQTQRASQAEAGCAIYRFSVDLHDPLAFYLVELWQDEASLAAHFKGAAFAAFITQLPQLGRVEASIARSGDLQPYQIKR